MTNIYNVSNYLYYPQSYSYGNYGNCPGTVIWQGATCHILFKDYLVINVLYGSGQSTSVSTYLDGVNYSNFSVGGSGNWFGNCINLTSEGPHYFKIVNNHGYGFYIAQLDYGQLFNINKKLFLIQKDGKTYSPLVEKMDNGKNLFELADTDYKQYLSAVNYSGFGIESLSVNVNDDLLFKNYLPIKIRKIKKIFI